MRTDEELIEALREKYDTDEAEPEERRIEAVCCPYCGQIHETLSPGEDARLVCTCDGARKWQAAEDRRERLCLAIGQLFGENCRAESPEFEPLGDAEICALYEIAGYAAHGLIGGVSVTVRDGSVCRIGEKVRRSVSVKREVE